tara:strand:+ start:795 stop:1133 length:339 start_codon:yes stop_codon:yes gene_type:complete
MGFLDLTWNADFLNGETNQNMGFQAQYEADNGCLLIVDTKIEGIETPLASATEAGQLYKCTILSWDRSPHSVEEDCTNNRVDSIIDVVEAIQGETFTEVTTTTTIRPKKRWD